MSDQEVIRNAVEFYLEERQIGCGTIFENGRETRVCYKPYASYEEFISINPDCCRMEALLPEYGRVPFFHKYWYDYRGTVYINSLLQRIESGSIVLEDDDYRYSNPYDEIVPVSSCGNPLMLLLET